MTTYLKSKLNVTRWFLAGMGTVLSIVPGVSVDRTQSPADSSQRLAFATNRVGAYFNIVHQREKQGTREQKSKTTQGK